MLTELAIALTLILTGVAAVSPSLDHVSSLQPATTDRDVGDTRMAVALSCSSLRWPTAAEIRQCVTSPAVPQGFECTASGACACIGTADCFNMGSERKCESVFCNDAGCVASGCVNRPQD